MEKKNDKTELFERMPVGKALLTMAIPTIISQLITMIYNLADTFFIGMSNDPYKVASPPRWGLPCTFVCSTLIYRKVYNDLQTQVEGA